MAIPSKSITRQIRGFPQGINSYVEPLLLPRTQLSFASNATFRGNFATQRPNYLRFSFVDTNGGTDLAAFQSGLYQGAAYYRTGNNGYLMVAVNGYLFQITPNFTTNVATVKKIATPSQNSTTAAQNWLWQSEEYLIYTDGVNLPIFWDGSTSRRSLGSNLTQLAVVNSSFDAPSIGQYVNPVVSLVAAYTGPVPAVVLIDGAQYEITGSNNGIAGTTATLFLDQVSGSGGASDYIQPGTGVYISSAYAGVVSQSSQSDFPPEPVAGTSGTQFTVNVLLPTSPQAGNVAIGTAVYDSAQYCGTITNANSGTIAALGGAISVFPDSVYTSFSVTVNGNYNSGKTGAIALYDSTVGELVKVWTGDVQSSVYNGSSTTLTGLIDQSIGKGGHTSIPSNCYVNFQGQASGALVSLSPLTCPTSLTSSGSIVLTLSKNFQGAIGDVLSIPVTGQSFSTVSATVQQFSGQEVQVVMPSSFTTANVGIPIGNTALVTDTTQSSATPVQFGTTFSTSPAVGSTIQVLMTPATGHTLVGGQTVYFTAGVAGGGTQLIVGIILASQNNAPSLTNPSNGTFGAAPNQFTLTLSQPFTGNTGDAMQIGSGGTLAQFTVDTITSRAGGVILCHMTNNYQGVIPIVLPDAANTADLVVDLTQKNQTGGPLLTLVGTYPTNASAGAITTGSLTSITGLLTQTSGVQALPNYVVEIAVTTTQAGGTPTAGSPDLFVVASTTSGGSGTTPTVNLFNINATPQSQVSAGTSIYAIPELPQCRMGAYGMGRNWVAVTDGTTCNSFVASDIVGSSSGTPPNNTDAVLKVSQNFDLANGLTFQISGAGEEIVAMAFLAQLNVALGQGPLNIFTDDSVINCQAPTDASTWSTLTSPIITSGLIGSGGISQDAVVQENADLIFRLAGGGVQSVETATIGFSQWGNTPISNEIIRVIEGDAVNLIPFTSIVVFNNRLLMSCQFSQQPRGVIGSAAAVLNFDSISTLQGKQPSIWEGQWTGLNVLQFVTGFFNGAEQCFALTLNNGQIGLSQILLDTAATVDNGNAPVAWEFETGMVFDPKSETPESRSYKRLINGEFSVSEIVANVTVAAYYKPDQYNDQNSGWVPWYTTNIIYGGASDTGFRSRLGLGEPNPKVFDSTNNRPLREAYDFQVKFVITGSCKFIVGRFEAVEIPEPAFAQPK